MAGGYMGKILWVDLSKNKIEQQEIDEDVYRKFLGGYGLGAKILFERMKRGADPLGPGNILGLVPGLLTGTGAVFAGRFMAVAKSPLTGGWGDSNCGGYFGPEVKKAGYDGIFITGKSKKPVYLFILDGKHELRDASHLWGKDALEAEKELKDELGDRKYQIAVIGTSGENLSLISGIVTDRGRIAARSGLGAVMGSKKLKAVAVKGSGTVPVHDKAAMKSETQQFLDRIKVSQKIVNFVSGKLLTGASVIFRLLPVHSKQESILWRTILKKFGTCGIMTFSAQMSDAGIKNWKGVGHLDFPLDKSVPISDANITKHQVKKYNCHKCPIACGGIMKIEGGPYPLEESHKPEYETIAAFGSMNLVSDPHVIFKANDMCNRAGMDTISAGATIAFAMECYEKGVITSADTDGIELNWENGDAVLKLLDKMIRREGIGDVLADGVKKASEKLGKGSGDFAIHAGGQEVPMHDPRFDPGFGIGYYLEPTPGRHTTVSYTYWELEEPHKKFSEAKAPGPVMTKGQWYNPRGKGKKMAILSKYLQVANGCGLCIFGLQIGGDIPVFKWVNAAAGWNLSERDFIEIGERIETIRHSFNLREGLKPLIDFKPAARTLGHPPLTAGPTAGVSLDMDVFAKEFYDEYGWDYKSGMPRKISLRMLGLDNVMKELY